MGGTEGGVDPFVSVTSAGSVATGCLTCSESVGGLLAEEAGSSSVGSCTALGGESTNGVKSVVDDCG